MKKLLILLFSILISFNSYGEWTKLGENIDGDSYYIEFDTIKARNGYVYWWSLSDYITPNSSGDDMSAKFYFQGDCGLYRFKYLSGIFYKQSMGMGENKIISPPNDWYYAVPKSAMKSEMEYVCDYVE